MFKLNPHDPMDRTSVFYIPSPVFLTGSSAGLLLRQSRNLYGGTQIGGTGSPCRRRLWEPSLRLPNKPVAHPLSRSLRKGRAQSSWLCAVDQTLPNQMRYRCWRTS